MSTNVPFDADFDVRAPLPPASRAPSGTFLSETPSRIAFSLGVSTAVAVCALIAVAALLAFALR